MAEEEKQDGVCPFCREDIKPGAVKCKHCGSALAAARPDHEGVCPFCREDIKPDAVKCKHCKSNLGPDPKHGCGCNDGVPAGAAALARMDNGFGPDSGMRDCENDCTLDFVDCMTSTTNRRSRAYCLGRMRWCSLFCRAGGGSFGGGGFSI